MPQIDTLTRGYLPYWAHHSGLPPNANIDGGRQVAVVVCRADLGTPRHRDRPAGFGESTLKMQFPCHSQCNEVSRYMQSGHGNEFTKLILTLRSGYLDIEVWNIKI